MLEISGLSVDYGPIDALRDVSLSVGDGQLVAILGANGAGKTTLLRTISGLVRASAGHDPLRRQRRSARSGPTRSCAAASSTCRKAAASSRT